MSGGQKQAVAIARAVYFKRHASCSWTSRPARFRCARQRRSSTISRSCALENMSHVLLTRDLYHAHQVCDRFVVMSHGQIVYDAAKADTSMEELTRHVVLT